MYGRVKAEARAKLEVREDRITPVDLGRKASGFHCSMLFCRLCVDLPTSHYALTDCGMLGFSEKQSNL